MRVEVRWIRERERWKFSKLCNSNIVLPPRLLMKDYKYKMINNTIDPILIVIHTGDIFVSMNAKSSRFVFLFLIAGLPVMHISQGVKRQSLCVLTELSSSISTLKILKRKKVWMKGRKSFNSFSPLPASFLVLPPRYFSVINNDFSVFYSAFSFLPWKSTQSINNQLVRSKRNVRRFKRISSLFPKVKLKIFFLVIPFSFLSLPPPPLPFFYTTLRSRAHVLNVFLKFSDRHFILR